MEDQRGIKGFATAILVNTIAALIVTAILYVGAQVLASYQRGEGTLTYSIKEERTGSLVILNVIAENRGSSAINPLTFEPVFSPEPELFGFEIRTGRATGEWTGVLKSGEKLVGTFAATHTLDLQNPATMFQGEYAVIGPGGVERRDIRVMSSLEWQYRQGRLILIIFLSLLVLVLAIVLVWYGYRRWQARAGAGGPSTPPQSMPPKEQP